MCATHHYSCFLLMVQTLMNVLMNAMIVVTILREVCVTTLMEATDVTVQWATLDAIVIHINACVS